MQPAGRDGRASKSKHAHTRLQRCELSCVAVRPGHPAAGPGRRVRSPPALTLLLADGQLICRPGKSAHGNVVGKEARTCTCAHGEAEEEVGRGGKCIAKTGSKGEARLLAHLLSGRRAIHEDNQGAHGQHGSIDGSAPHEGEVCAEQSNEDEGHPEPPAGRRIGQPEGHHALGELEGLPQLVRRRARGQRRWRRCRGRCRVRRCRRLGAHGLA